MSSGFKIQTGKDMAIERERLRTTGKRWASRGELMQNADNLARWLHEHVPGDIAVVLVVAPRGQPEFGVTAGNAEGDETERILQKAVKRVRRATATAAKAS